MMRTPFLAIAALLTLLALTQCGNEPSRPDPFQVRAVPGDLAGDAGSVVRANTAFAFDLYRNLRDTSDGNLFLSPYSVSTALQMTLAGAAGETDAEMRSVLRLDMPEDQAHRGAGALVASLDRGTKLDGYELRTANRLWTQEGFDFREAFLTIMTDRYLAGLGSMDFAADPEACRRAINDWVAAQTSDRIRNLFPAGSINQETVLVLANAIYFKGLWAVQFDPDDTRDAPFRVSADKTVTARMMHRKLETRFADTAEAHVVELPYRGGDLSMLAVLPTAVDGLAGLESALSADLLESWIAELHEADRDVYLPRFSFTSEFPLAATLAGMGMPSAFLPGTADFSDLDGTRRLFLQTVMHKAFVEVTEEGTEAAAATGVSVGITSIPPQFRADRPFLFLIRDNVTGSVLFLGRVTDPTRS